MLCTTHQHHRKKTAATTKTITNDVVANRSLELVYRTHAQENADRLLSALRGFFHDCRVTAPSLTSQSRCDHSIMQLVCDYYIELFKDAFYTGLRTCKSDTAGAFEQAAAALSSCRASRTHVAEAPAVRKNHSFDVGGGKTELRWRELLNAQEASRNNERKMSFDDEVFLKQDRSSNHFYNRVHNNSGGSNGSAASWTPPKKVTTSKRWRMKQRPLGPADVSVVEKAAGLSFGHHDVAKANGGKKSSVWNRLRRHSKGSKVRGVFCCCIFAVKFLWRFNRGLHTRTRALT